jgi:hypothetical protein
VCDGHHGAIHDGLLTVTGEAPSQLVWTWTGTQLVETQSLEIEVVDLTIEEDIVSALVTMGCRKAEAREAVTRARPHVGSRPSHEVLLRAALQQLHGGASTAGRRTHRRRRRAKRGAAHEFEQSIGR